MKFFAIVLSIVSCVAVSASVDSAAWDAPLLHVRVEELPERELHMYAAKAVNMKRQAPSFDTYGDAVNFVNNLQQTPDTSSGLTQPWGTAKKCVEAPHPSTCASCAIGSNIVFASATIVCGVKFSAGKADPLLKGTQIASCVGVASGIWYTNLVSCLGK